MVPVVVETHRSRHRPSRRLWRSWEKLRTDPGTGLSGVEERPRGSPHERPVRPERGRSPNARSATVTTCSTPCHPNPFPWPYAVNQSSNPHCPRRSGAAGNPHGPRCPTLPLADNLNRGNRYEHRNTPTSAASTPPCSAQRCRLPCKSVNSSPARREQRIRDAAAASDRRARELGHPATRRTAVCGNRAPFGQSRTVVDHRAARADRGNRCAWPTPGKTAPPVAAEAASVIDEQLHAPLRDHPQPREPGHDRRQRSSANATSPSSSDTKPPLRSTPRTDSPSWTSNHADQGSSPPDSCAPETVFDQPVTDDVVPPATRARGAAHLTYSPSSDTYEPAYYCTDVDALPYLGPRNTPPSSASSTRSTSTAHPRAGLRTCTTPPPTSRKTTCASGSGNASASTRQPSTPAPAPHRSECSWVASTAPAVIPTQRAKRPRASTAQQ